MSGTDQGNNLPEELKGRTPTLVVIPMPKDQNSAGNIFGGWLMSQMDLAAADRAFEVAKGRIVTRAVNSMEFNEPVFTGDKVCLYTKVTKIGNTSITVEVESWSKRRLSNEYVKVTTAQFTFVKIDKENRPVKVSA